MIGLATQREDVVALGVATMLTEEVPMQWSIIRSTLSERKFDLNMISDQDSLLRFRILPFDINNLVSAFKLQYMMKLPAKWKGYTMITRDAFQDSLDVVRHCKTPIDVEGLEQFLGLRIWYAPFIRGYATMAKPL